MPYLFKNLSKSRLSDPFFGLFLVISVVGSQIYIANLAIFKIWVFSATFWHEITLYSIDIDKKRFITPSFNTLEPLWKSDFHHTQLSGTSATVSYTIDQLYYYTVLCCQVIDQITKEHSIATKCDFTSMILKHFAQDQSTQI